LFQQRFVAFVRVLITRTMIDTSIEEAITLNRARHLPAVRRNGRAPDLATMYRWVTRGVAGVKLKSVKVGGARCTSEQAVRRFLEQLADPNPAPAGRRTSSQLERDVDRADAETAEIDQAEPRRAPRGVGR
jgi:hypothetical protein